METMSAHHSFIQIEKLKRFKDDRYKPPTSSDLLNLINGNQWQIEEIRCLLGVSKTDEHIPESIQQLLNFIIAQQSKEKVDLEGYSPPYHLWRLLVLESEIYDEENLH